MSEKGKKLAGLAGLTGGFASKDRGDEPTQGAGDTGRDTEDQGDEGKLAAMEELHDAMKAGDHKAMSAALDAHHDLHMKGK